MRIFSFNSKLISFTYRVSTNAQYYFFTSGEFSHKRNLLCFPWGLSDGKSQIFRTLSIMADLNDALVWIVSILPTISKCFNLLSNPLGTIPSALTTISITVTHRFFKFSGKIQVFVYLFVFFYFYSMVGGIPLEPE